MVANSIKSSLLLNIEKRDLKRLLKALPRREGKWGDQCTLKAELDLQIMQYTEINSFLQCKEEALCFHDYTPLES